MSAKQKVIGPYRVRKSSSVYKVVEMVDNSSDGYQELRPNKTYLNRQSAYGKCLRLNRRWQEELHSDENHLLEYWQKATN